MNREQKITLIVIASLLVIGAMVATVIYVRKVNKPIVYDMVEGEVEAKDEEPDFKNIDLLDPEVVNQTYIPLAKNIIRSATSYRQSDSNKSRLDRLHAITPDRSDLTIDDLPHLLASDKKGSQSKSKILYTDWAQIDEHTITVDIATEIKITESGKSRIIYQMYNLLLLDDQINFRPSSITLSDRPVVI